MTGDIASLLDGHYARQYTHEAGEDRYEFMEKISDDWHEPNVFQKAGQSTNEIGAYMWRTC
ncbi:hypothetical protein [Oceanobacillus sp. CF4.6]|uniref:hypothetical protein n=1 Tax=Oceanobacillus sp. CF4.6 TaxID=3373080 RepID=UPI003EE5FFD0